MNIAVVGCGHVGLVVGACLAEKNHSVACIDTNTKRIEQLDNGEMPFYEPGLEALVKENVSWGNLSFTSSFSAGLAEADVVFVTVPVPVGERDRTDMSFMKSALLDIVEALNTREEQKHCTIVIKSTVPPGTCDVFEMMIYDHIDDMSNVDLAFNPEFLREGSAVHDFMFNERIVIGTSVSANEYSDFVKDLLYEVYKVRNDDQSFCRQVIVTDFVAAEMIKLAANSFLALKLTYAHMLKGLGDKMGADNRAVAIGIGADERIGHAFMQAGIGFGGSCLSKDVRMLGKAFEDASLPSAVLDHIEKINESMWHQFVHKIQLYLGFTEGKRIALWGLSFKPDTDDTTNSPAVKIARWFTKRGASVTVYDPKSTPPRNLTVTVATDMYSCCDGADALIIATDWQCFLEADMEEVSERMFGHMVFLGRQFREITEGDLSTGLEFFS
ncbi:UDP-glucose/GDP-mannose dehydrogenase family protein [Akkermansia muciniphila]|jgi:hypothetical protein|uniref:UDP-glucose dehydrogenase family protein n=1 Tax=Akkermansia muciniphila TaxID=239935 RepID=UPI001C064303|nr:nucleotide sugar dehydrogenase [Akkermansia muciniphila]QWO98895.1 UDP-glucose/GDP-mannose dehydrogenase family protein [Akkermansia muciniphila]